MPDEKKDKPTVENRWWAEIGQKRERERNRDQAPAETPERPPAGHKFFRIAEGYDQDRARTTLTDQNLRLLGEVQPQPGEWTHVPLLKSRHPRREIERIKHVLDLPPYARGVIVDSGRTVRLLVTGTPVGERLLELALVDQPSFDAWVRGEWVREELYRDPQQGLNRFRRLIRRYLSPDAIAEAESISARA
jgi:hypothetical protein